MARLLRGLLALIAVSAVAYANAAGGARERREDFDAMWRAIEARYVYPQDPARWRRARQEWRPRAAAARTRERFVAALEGALLALRDDHVRLSESRLREVPEDTDMWARWHDGRAVIEAVRYAGDADYVGLHPGDAVVRVDGYPVAVATRRWLPAGNASPQDRDWALRHALAGPRRGSVALELSGAQPRRVEIERDGHRAAASPALAARRIGDARDIGYIRVRTLADPQLLGQIDTALSSLKDTRGLILDLRETRAGDRQTTLAMLARFAVREAAWQIREGRNGKRETDRVAPLGAVAHKGPLLVLADRWTAGESEALVAGLVAVGEARYVGTSMAGLRGELASVRLPHSGITLHFPAEKALLPDGTPREALRPVIEVDLAAPNGGPGDPILYQALKALEKK